MTDATSTVVGQIRKNATEDIKVALTTFHDIELVDIRAYADFNNGHERKPTRKGIALKIDQLPELINLLQQTQAEASRRGWLTSETAVAS